MLISPLHPQSFRLSKSGRFSGIRLLNKLPGGPDAGGPSLHLENHTDGTWGGELANPRGRLGFACTFIPATWVGVYSC